MLSALLLSISLVLSLLPIQVAGSPNLAADEKELQVDFETFQRQLGQVDPQALHAALHSHSPKKFKHGMFREDKTAVEAIHRDNPPLAVNIVRLAKRDNGTVTTTPAPVAPDISTVVIPSESSLPTDLTNPVQASSLGKATPAPGPIGSETSGIGIAISSIETTTSPSPASNNLPTTLTSTSFQSSVTGQSSPSGPTTSNNAPPPPTSTPPSSSPSRGSVFTFTNSYGVVIVTTVGGGLSTVSSIPSFSSLPEPTESISSRASVASRRVSSTSTAVHTTTLPNGSRSTVTAVTVVAVGGDEGTTPTGNAGVQTSATRTSSPGLQTGMAVRARSVANEILCVAGGALGLAIIM